MVAFRSYGFETILNPRSRCPYTGKEQAELLGDDIKLYTNEYGSFRFVLYIKSRAVSALQIMSKDGQATVANVITVKQHRRKGYAKKLWNEAKKIFPVIYHSANLSEDGKMFAEKCK